MVEICRNIRFSNSYINKILDKYVFMLKIVNVYKYTSSVD